ncbi:MAG: response regulator [Mycolicibacterium sp.]|nr:response regulator [Mycolicibacterium sp.]
MGSTELKVLVVDDDFRVGNMHAGIVNALPGFSVTATATTLAAARKADPVDLALVDVYLPDGSGVDFVRELNCDAFVLSAATDAPTIRAAMAAGALSYLVKPSPPPIWRPSCPVRPLPQRSSPDRTSAVRRWTRRSTRFAPASRRHRLSPRWPHPPSNSCWRRCVQRAAHVVHGAVRADRGVPGDRAALPLDAGQCGRVKIQLRYGTTGRPEQEFLAIEKPTR